MIDNCVEDDGIEKDHPDLIRNYDPLSSTDINDGDNDPNPRYSYRMAKGSETKVQLHDSQGIRTQGTVTR